jgi:hypothetical protein
LRHGLGVVEIAHETLLRIGERERSDACVTESFTRQRKPESDLMHSSYPGRRKQRVASTG